MNIAPKQSHKDKTKTILWLGLLGLVIIFVIAVMSITIPIENKLKRDVQAALDGAGYGRITTQMSGRDVYLSGQVGNENVAKRTIEIASRITGVRVVDTDYVISPLRAAHIQLRKPSADFAILMYGELPDQETVDAIYVALNEVSDDSIDMQVVITPEITLPNWIDVVPEVVLLARAHDVFEIELGAGQLAFGASVQSSAEYDTYVERLTSITNQHNMALINRLGILPDE